LEGSQLVGGRDVTDDFRVAAEECGQPVKWIKWVWARGLGRPFEGSEKLLSGGAQRGLRG
jgi:hypothetical protein